MKLNILTRQAGKKAEEPYEVRLEDCWRIYFRLLPTIGQNINQREEDVIAYILSTNPEVDHFTAPHATNLRKELNLARSEVTRLKQSLKAKRIIDDNNVPVRALMNLHKHVVAQGEVTFVFPLAII